MNFKTDVYKITSNNVKNFPVGTPKIIRDLKVDDEIYFEMNPRENSSKADNITIFNLTNKTSHSMKKGKLFNAIYEIGMTLK